MIVIFLLSFFSVALANEISLASERQHVPMMLLKILAILNNADSLDSSSDFKLFLPSFQSFRDVSQLS